MTFTATTIQRFVTGNGLESEPDCIGFADARFHNMYTSLQSMKLQDIQQLVNEVNFPIDWRVGSRLGGIIRYTWQIARDLAAYQLLGIRSWQHVVSSLQSADIER